ncbi:MAG: hypothetical protein CME13_00900 [Gemmatimonadetes bacterium]|nr:hypothetical protein [Gemmatimonadaceae bacterium]MBU06523.1 hypothetical protein [Gemmatimonadota bacterium]HCV25483.1 hypothetical protein [Candidatus Latescibacterota bacterium]
MWKRRCLPEGFLRTLQIAVPVGGPISPYREIRRRPSWIKIKNPDYSQAEGRGDLFKREN